jgi:hypothetical protein
MLVAIPYRVVVVLRDTQPVVGRDSVVDVVTCYGLGGPGIESR